MNPQDDDIYRKFSEMLLRQRKMVWAMCYRHSGGSVAVCEDLVQDVFEALWRGFGAYREGGGIKVERAWVWWRTRTLLSHADRRRTEQLLAAGCDDRADEESERVRQKETLEEVMACLRPGEREVVRLHIEGYLYEEIAAMTGRTQAAVKQTMYRAMKKMKQSYNKQHGTEQ